jgi:transposase
VSRQLLALGHEVIVANAHAVKLITQAVRKNDRLDARKLAKLARIDPELLSPIRHRGERAQTDLAMIRARAEAVESRTALINSARGLAKPMGERLQACDAEQVSEVLADGLSAAAQQIVRPLLKIVEAIGEQIAVYDRQIEAMAQRYPEVELLTQVYGVGTLIGLTYVLTIEDAERFAHSRDVGCYLGLQPKQRESGDSQPELGISKRGDRLLRSYLVQACHCMLRKGAPDSDLRAWGLGKAQSGGKRGKRRAIVGMARKLAVLLHRLWSRGEVYDPLYHRKAVAAAAQRKSKVAA